MTVTSENASPIVIERLVNAPVENVWQALTRLDEMKQWYFDIDHFEPTTGFRFSFRGKGAKGEEYVHRCEILEVVPERKIRYSWTYEGREGYSEVTFELFPEDEKTLVRLTHQGIESFSGNGPDFLASSFRGGWTYLVQESLPGYVEKK